MTDESESCADFLIAEVREAMIENMLCVDVNMFRRGIKTDSFEEAAKIWLKETKPKLLQTPTATSPISNHAKP